MSVRPAVAEDSAAIAELCNAISTDLYEQGDVDADEVRSWFAYPNIAMFAVERDGGLAGYADIRDEEGDRFPIDLRVHPDARGQGIPDALIAATEEWSRPRAKPRGVMRGYTSERDEELREALERNGYALIRHSLHMEIALDVEIEAPRWPDGISLRQFDRARDEGRVHQAQQEAFADHWDFRWIPLEEWRRFQIETPRFDPDLWWLAEDGEEIAGFSLNNWRFGDLSLGWVGDLGVRRPWRRRGLALALLRHSFRDFRGSGAARVGLGVDAENLTGAVRLYERAGMHAVRRDDAYEKALAP